MYYIYKITNELTNESYIGLSKNPFERFHGHIRDAKSGKYKNRKMSVAFNKYDISNFNFKILEKTKDESREAYYIELYDSFENGYNHTKDGKSFMEGTNLIPKYIQYDDFKPNDKNIIMEKWLVGMSMRSIARKYNYAERGIRQVIIDNGGLELKKHSNKRDNRGREAEIILKIDPKTKEVVGRYKGQTKAAESVNRGQTSIRKCLIGERRTSGGYIFIYEKEYLKNKKTKIHNFT